MAAAVLADWLASGDFPNRMLDSVAADHAYVMEVVYGVAKWRRELEWIARSAVKRLPASDAMPFLFVGLYEIFHMSDAPAYATVNETVEAAKQRLPQSAAGFVNAILRTALRTRDATIRSLQSQPLGIRQSHPEVLVKRWERQFGEVNTRRLCEWNNGRASTVIAINPAKTDADQYLAALKQAGVEATPHPFRPKTCLTLPRGVRIEELPGFKEGIFSVQDPSTVPAVELLDPQPGESILDACAAPGGKTMLIGERMADKGVLIAMDVYDDRLARLRENLQRMSLSVAVVFRANIADAKDKLARARLLPPDGGFDAAIVDVPCSNTGVLRRRPDARWRFTMARLATLQGQQVSILDSAASLVKPGGRLVYSTCSLETEESEGLVRGWIGGRPGWHLVKETRLFPPRTETDGSFAALLRRTT